jgi:hypothetical protein
MSHESQNPLPVTLREPYNHKHTISPSSSSGTTKDEIQKWNQSQITLRPRANLTSLKGREILGLLLYRQINNVSTLLFTLKTTAK